MFCHICIDELFFSADKKKDTNKPFFYALLWISFLCLPHLILDEIRCHFCRFRAKRITLTIRSCLQTNFQRFPCTFHPSPHRWPYLNMSQMKSHFEIDHLMKYLWRSIFLVFVKQIFLLLESLFISSMQYHHQYPCNNIM